MWWERVERQALVERQIAAVFMAAGQKDVELPSLQEVRERFDAALVEEPRPLAPVDVEQMELRKALGVM